MTPTPDTTLVLGDCLEVLQTMEDSSIGAIVTDPPYGLDFMAKDWDHGVPSTTYWQEMLRVAKPGAYLLSFGGTRTFHRLMVAIEDAGWELRDTLMWVYASGMPHGIDVGKALARKSDPTADSWAGWNSSLKPAWEPIVMARKPFTGSLLTNVATYGVGALHIDACRVNPSSAATTQAATEEPNRGRFPSNVVHDGTEEVRSHFPEAKGQLADLAAGVTRKRGACYGDLGATTRRDRRYDVDTSAARFFYCAKASPTERGRGNDHPTVKPLALMRWLITLVAPKDTTILDPFCGSGTTLIAASSLGVTSIGIDRDAHYLDLARERLAAASLC